MIMELECPSTVSSFRSRLRFKLRSISSESLSDEMRMSISEESRMLRLMLMAFDMELRAVSPALEKKELMGGWERGVEGVVADVEGRGVGCEPVLGDIVVRWKIRWRKPNTCLFFLFREVSRESTGVTIRAAEGRVTAPAYLGRLIWELSVCSGETQYFDLLIFSKEIN